MVSSSHGNPTKNKSSSFDAFSRVDELVAKPVLGSDGAASWQAFRGDRRTKEHHYQSSAPKAPLKRADKLGTGFSTWDEERAHEGRVREEAGHASTGSGYSNFKKGNNTGEAKERKRKAQIEARIRPDDKEYFIPSQTFQGWKFDYIFTTRNNNMTGYFWDGMDSVKRQNGELKSEEPKLKIESSLDNKYPENVLKRKKKKRKTKSDPVIVSDPNNPMEQMQAIMERRKQSVLGMIVDHNLPSGWKAAKDPLTGNTYYFHRATGDRSWEKPKISENVKGNGHGDANESLPAGWNSVIDKASGKTYYHHTNGKTTWTKPE